MKHTRIKQPKHGWTEQFDIEDQLPTIYTLIKQSTPGWTEEFDTEEQLVERLLTCLCETCLESAGSKLLSDLLATPCGLEYDFN